MYTAVLIAYVCIVIFLVGSLSYRFKALCTVNSLPFITSDKILPGDIITTISSPTDLKKALELSISGNFDTPYNHCLLAVGDGRVISSERNPVLNVSNQYTKGIDVRFLQVYAATYPRSTYVVWKARKPLTQSEIDAILRNYRGKDFADGYIRAFKAWLGISGCVPDDKKLCTEFIVEAVNFPSNRCAADTTLKELIEGMKDYAVGEPHIIVL